MGKPRLYVLLGVLGAEWAGSIWPCLLVLRDQTWAGTTSWWWFELWWQEGEEHLGEGGLFLQQFSFLFCRNPLRCDGKPAGLHQLVSVLVQMRERESEPAALFSGLLMLAQEIELWLFCCHQGVAGLFVSLGAQRPPPKHRLGAGCGCSVLPASRGKHLLVGQCLCWGLAKPGSGSSVGTQCPTSSFSACLRVQSSFQWTIFEPLLLLQSSNRDSKEPGW